MRSLARFIAGLLLAIAAVGAVFVLGMRAKWPPVLDAVRRLSKATKPLVLRSAGTAGGSAAVVHHVGRSTGRTYTTPVGAQPTDDGFVIALPYGPNTDWLKNVLASGSATIVRNGARHAVDRPQVVPFAAANPLFPPADQRAHSMFGVEQFLVVRHVGAP
jgi:deazaflavin-dependent oxidoreductase (nitroreductase family)